MRNSEERLDCLRPFIGTRRTPDLGMVVNWVDVFAIGMAKSIECATKIAVDVASVLQVMQETVDEVAELCGEGIGPQHRAAIPEVRQLALLLSESQERYGRRT